jgi:hypothetical protein
MTPPPEQELRPRDEPSEGKPPPPATPPRPKRQTESRLDWLENQQRGRRSKFLLDFTIIAITLLITAVLVWVVLLLRRH